MPGRVPTIDDVDVADKRVLLRADFNVPMKDGTIVDDRRITAELPTMRDLIDRKAKVIVVTHLGRPKGKRVDDLSTEIIAQSLREHVQARVVWCDDIVGAAAKSAVAALQPGEVLVLQNVRFDPGEEQNDPAFARELASLADFWCMDAFGTAHRAHASTQGVGEVIPGFAGKLLSREIEVLDGLFENPKRPVVAIVAGAKISTKIGVLENLLPLVDTLWVCGAMAATFIRAQGYTTGTSLCEEDQLGVATDVLNSEHAAKVRLPIDEVVSVRADQPVDVEVVEMTRIPDGKMTVDAGPETVKAIAATVATAGTVIWNGPLGVYEVEPFAAGTQAVARAVAASKAVSVVSGGDLVAAVDAVGVEADIGYISTGGGATLEFLEGKPLPGIAVLERQSVA